MINKMDRSSLICPLRFWDIKEGTGLCLCSMFLQVLGFLTLTGYLIMELTVWPGKEIKPHEKARRECTHQFLITSRGHCLDTSAAALLCSERPKDGGNLSIRNLVPGVVGWSVVGENLLGRYAEKFYKQILGHPMRNFRA